VISDGGREVMMERGNGRKSNKQTNKQTSKHTNKQTNRVILPIGDRTEEEEVLVEEVEEGSCSDSQVLSMSCG
jgi:hypothetical protein